MASLVLGVVGAIIGTFIEPGIGTAIGWSLGSALGGILDPPKAKGPQLSDLKLQGSSYGSFIGIVYGTVRIAGDIIWQTDLVEHSHTEDQGGKGGGTEVTTFTYTSSFAIQICEGPVEGVFKIWADGRLILTVDEFGEQQGDLPIVIYLGDEEQLPDPTMEAIEGVGNVPAHRGYCYVVFTDFDLTDFGNRIPAFTFEVSTARGPIPYRISTFEPPSFNGNRNPSYVSGAAIENGELLVSAWTGGRGEGLFELTHYDLAGNILSVDDPIVFQDIPANDFPKTFAPCVNNPHITVGIASEVGNFHASHWYVDGVDHGEVGPLGAYFAVVWTGGTNSLVYFDGHVFGIGADAIPSTNARVAKWVVSDGIPHGNPVATYTLDGGGFGGTFGIAIGDDDMIYVGGMKNPDHADGQWALIKLDPDDLTFVEGWTVAQIPYDWFGGYAFVVYQGNIMFASDDEVFQGGHGDFAASAWKLTPGVQDPTDDTGEPWVRVGATPALNGNCISLGGGLGLTGDGIVSLNPPPGQMPLSAVVADISERCDLFAYNVGALTDKVDGFSIGSPISGRAAIETLMPVYFFDGVESDALVKFVRRGGESVATIAYDELAAVVDGGALPAPLETTRGPDAELPITVTITYINKGADYQSSTQEERRQTGGSMSPLNIDVPLVLADSKAKQVVDAILYHPWLERNRRTFHTTRKYLALEPTDVVTVAGIELRITQKKEDASGIITFDALPAISSVYVQPSVGGTSGGFTPGTVGPVLTAQPTAAQFLDIPLVDDDDSEGFYVAMAGATNSSWGGATLYRSVDSGTSYTQIARSTTADTIGVASTVLGDFLGGDIFDELNTVTVVIGNGGGTLSSTTHTGMMNGGNKALLGGEILQYRDAVLIATNTYVLGGFLRGRRGTEWAIGTHSVNERFIVLPVGINIASAELNVSRLYKVVTTGGTLANASAITFANTGAAVRPYSVVEVGGGFGGGDCIISWTRRTRIGGEWVAYTDVPLSEDREMYTVEVWNSTFTTVVRTVTGITSPTFTYTSAMQTADFGSPQTAVYVKVYQNGRFVPSRGVRAHFPNNSLTWTSDLEPVPGPVPVPPPSGGGGGGGGGTATIPLVWGSAQVVQAYSVDYGGFSPTQAISISFTTPSGTSSVLGRLSLVEFADPPTPRTCCLSTVNGDFNTGLVGYPASKIADAIGPRVFYTVGTDAPYGAVRLEPSTTYYWNVRNGVTNAESCNIQVTLQKPAGL